MKNVAYCLFLFLFACVTPSFADRSSSEEVLKMLDQIIDSKETYHIQKEEEIKKIETSPLSFYG